jgi:hypothetical protein
VFLPTCALVKSTPCGDVSNVLEELALGPVLAPALFARMLGIDGGLGALTLVCVGVGELTITVGAPLAVDGGAPVPVVGGVIGAAGAVGACGVGTSGVSVRAAA